MIRVLHMLAFMVCATECGLSIRDLRGRIPKLVIFGAIGLIHGLVPAIAPHEYFAGFSTGSQVSAAGLAFVGSLMLSLGWRFYELWKQRITGLSPGVSVVIDSPDGQRLMRRLFWVCGALGMASWFVFVVPSGVSLGDVFASGRFAHRGAGNIYVTAVAHLFMFLSFVPPFVCFFLPRRYQLMGVAYAVSMATLIFAASMGTRADPIGLLGALLMGFALRRRINVGRFLFVSSLATVLVFLAIALYPIRHVMSRKTAGEVLELMVSPETYADALLRDPLSYHQMLIAATEFFPDTHPYLNGATYRRILVCALPARYFPSIKPRDTNMVFASVVAPYSARRNNTIPPTMIGDGYINFWGWPGAMFVMFMNGLAFGFVTHRMRTNVLWLIAIGSGFVRFALLAVRGQPYAVFVTVVAALVLVWMVGRICGFSYRRAKSTTLSTDIWLRSRGALHTYS